MSKLIPSAPISFSICAMVVSGAAPSSRVPDVPSEKREEDFHVLLMKLLHHAAQSCETAGQVSQQIELVTIIRPEIGIHVPDEHGINRADSTLRIRQKAIDRVLDPSPGRTAVGPRSATALARRCARSTPSRRVRTVPGVTEQSMPLAPPCLQPFQPPRLFCWTRRPGKKHFLRRRRLRRDSKRRCATPDRGAPSTRRPTRNRPSAGTKM